MIIIAQLHLIVSGRITFDAIGRSIRQYYPILDGDNAATTFNYGYDDHVTEMTYDALDRNKSTKLPDNSITKIDYGFGSFTDGILSNYFTTLVTDAKLKQKTTYRDVRELIHGVKEEGGILTRYKYDPLKQIRHVYDAEDNHTEVEYDLLGRRKNGGGSGCPFIHFPIIFKHCCSDNYSIFNQIAT